MAYNDPLSDIVSFIIYDPTGKVVMQCTGDKSMMPHAAVGGNSAVIGSIDPVTHYIDPVTTSSTPRPSNPATCNTVGLTVDLASLPVPSTLIVDTTEYQCNESTASISFDFAGNHVIVVKAFPYQDKSFNVSVA